MIAADLFSCLFEAIDLVGYGVPGCGDLWLGSPFVLPLSRRVAISVLRNLRAAGSRLVPVLLLMTGSIFSDVL
jgi:hypothetical protein